MVECTDCFGSAPKARQLSGLNMDGAKTTRLQVWLMNLKWLPVNLLIGITGTMPQPIYENRDKRFYATLHYNGKPWKNKILYTAQNTPAIRC